MFTLKVRRNEELASAATALRLRILEFSRAAFSWHGRNYQNFNRYFELGRGSISMNRDMIEESMDPDSDFQHLSFEFYPKTMGKHQDGESRHYDRSFKEIVIYDDRDDSRIEVSDMNGTTLYLSPEFNNDQFLPAMRYRDSKRL